MTKSRFIAIVGVVLCTSSYIAISAAQTSKEPDKAVVSYEIVGEKISTSSAKSSSTNYEIVDTLTTYGTEGGLQSSTSYSVEVSNNLDAQAPASSVSDWATLEK